MKILDITEAAPSSSTIMKTRAEQWLRRNGSTTIPAIEPCWQYLRRHDAVMMLPNPTPQIRALYVYYPDAMQMTMLLEKQIQRIYDLDGRTEEFANLFTEFFCLGAEKQWILRNTAAHAQVSQPERRKITWAYSYLHQLIPNVCWWMMKLRPMQVAVPERELGDFYNLLFKYAHTAGEKIDWPYQLPGPTT